MQLCQSVAGRPLLRIFLAPSPGWWKEPFAYFGRNLKGLAMVGPTFLNQSIRW